MTLNELVRQQLDTGMNLLEQFTQDMTEQDATFQPCAGGVHLKWMLLHLAVSEDWIVSLLGDQPLGLPAELHDHYRGGNPCRADEPHTLEDCWNTFRENRARVTDFVASFPESRYDDPAPQGTPQSLPKVASLLGMLGLHPLWHFGQLTVTRRMLGKPTVM